MTTPQLLRNAAICCTLSFGFIACQKDARNADNQAMVMERESSRKGGTAAMKQTMFYALTASNEIIGYRSGNPLRETSATTLTGLSSGEKMLAIDFRPATGQLYGVSNNSRLYTINLTTGMVTPIAGSFMPAINGDAVGFDFNPTVDRIRLVTNTGQNLRLHPTTGMVAAADGSIISSANVTAVAYTNSFAGATSTTLYDIDVASNQLFIQSPPNNGTLVPVGSLGVQAVGEAGFDISPDNTVAIAALFGRGLEDDQMEESNGNKYRFYYINLTTGEAKNAGKTERTIIGLAISPNQ